LKWAQTMTHAYSLKKFHGCGANNK
jgi:hypothetical protein